MFVHGPNPDRLWLNLAYTFNDFRFDNDPLYGNNQLPGAPRHFLRAELLYKHPSGVYFGPNIEWVPQAYFVDSANTLDTEPYVLWGLKAGYNPEKSASRPTSRPATSPNALHRQHRHHQRRESRGNEPVRARHRPRRLRRRQIQMVRRRQTMSRSAEGVNRPAPDTLIGAEK